MRMITRHPLQAWLGFVLVWLIPRLCTVWVIDVFPSPQRGSQRLLPRFSLCYGGNVLAISLAVPRTRSSPLIRIHLWGRDMRIVVLTGSFFLANLVGLLYCKLYSVSRLSIEVLTLLFIALKKVNPSIPRPMHFSSVNTENC